MPLEKITNLLINSAFNILIFIASIAAGFLIFLIFYIIVNKIANHKFKHKKPTIPNLEVDAVPIIDTTEVLFDDEYSYKSIGMRFEGLKKLSIQMINNISKAYNPKSNTSFAEVKVKHLIMLSKDIVTKTDNLITEIVNSSFFKVVWTGFAGFTNIKTKIKRFFSKEKEEKPEYISMNVKDLKISYVLEKLDNIKQKNQNSDKEPKPSDPEATKKYFLFDKFINNKIKAFIREVGEEAILVYSGQIETVSTQLEVTHGN